MTRLRLLLLDADVVIELFELGVWDEIVNNCEISLSSIVVKEARYFHGKESKEPINLSTYIEEGRITVLDIAVSELKAFRKQIDSSYLSRLDDGEAESLAILMGSKESYKICTGDKIVYRILGRLQRPDQGISMEEMLHQIGYGQQIRDHFKKSYREKWTQVGQQDRVRKDGFKENH